MRNRSVVTIFLDELTDAHLGPGNDYSSYLDGKLVQSPEAPPDFVDITWVREPDVAWRCKKGGRIQPRKRTYQHADPTNLQPTPASEWLEQMQQRGEGKPRLTLASTVAQFADFDTGRNVRPSNATIARLTGRSIGAVNKGVRSMVNDGWLVSTGKSLKGVIVYALTLPPEGKNDIQPVK